MCGITNYQDAIDAIDSGADALGFVFYKKSPRYIEPLDACKIIEQLPPFVEKVGLFVEHSSNEINKISKEAKITLAQLHFEIEEKALSNIDINYLRVIRAQNSDDIDKYRDEYRLIDAFTKHYGGVGKRLNLDWFREKDCSKIILAGGLNIDNLDELNKFNFYGVDASSSLEREKGKKDSIKVKSFIDKAKSF